MRWTETDIPAAVSNCDRGFLQLLGWASNTLSGTIVGLGRLCTWQAAVNLPPGLPIGGRGEGTCVQNGQALESGIEQEWLPVNGYFPVPHKRYTCGIRCENWMHGHTRPSIPASIPVLCLKMFTAWMQAVPERVVEIYFNEMDVWINRPLFDRTVAYNEIIYVQ